MTDGQSPKKRTRRGSRGGRKRKKPAAAAADGKPGEVEDDAEATPIAVVADPEPETESPEYVPMSEWIEDFDRRAGSRR